MAQVTEPITDGEATRRMAECLVPRDVAEKAFHVFGEVFKQSNSATYGMQRAIIEAAVALDWHPHIKASTK